MHTFIETLERIHVAVAFAEHGLYPDGSGPDHAPAPPAASPAGVAA